MPPADAVAEARRVLGEAVPSEHRAAVAALADGLFTRATTAFPAVDLVAFAADLARHASAAPDPIAYLTTVRAEDVALASACATGAGWALTQFEQTYFREIDRAYARVRRSAVDPQDFTQRMRERLFVATAERRPRIADYAGQGDLRTWFRVAVTRTLTTEAMRPRRDAPSDDGEFGEIPSASQDPELELLRRKYTSEFRASFRRSLEAMEERDKDILRRVVVERLGIDAIASVYDIHRATAARWVQRAKEGLVRGVRKDLEQHLRVPGTELESILRLVASEVDVSVRALLPGA